ncbi:MAG: biotin/lipoate--protein ligase family protein [Alphaproteobacteria bacterium]
MFRDCNLPPLYRLITLGPDADVALEAARMAQSGADPATLVCAGREDRLDCAVILHPDLPVAKARLAIYVAALGLGDALGAALPPGIDVTFRWPNRIEANIAAVAEIGVVLPEGAGDGEPAAWMVAHFTLAIGALDGDGLHEGFPKTSLHDEGCAEATSAMLLEAFARHFLVWVNRWQDDGFDPIRAMWLRHARDHEEIINIEFGGMSASGMFEGIDDDGALVLKPDGAVRRIALIEAMAEIPC